MVGTLRDDQLLAVVPGAKRDNAREARFSSK